LKDIPSGKEVAEIDHRLLATVEVAISPDGGKVAICCPRLRDEDAAAADVQVWSVTGIQPKLSTCLSSKKDNDVISIAFDPRGTLFPLLAVARRTSVDFWQLAPSVTFDLSRMALDERTTLGKWRPIGPTFGPYLPGSDM
jgi:hypothetical protein